MEKDETSNNLEVSVVIPVMNGEKVIDRALDSVFAQTFVNFEIIVVDDGSTDQTAKLVSQRVDNRLTLLKHADNQGAAAARNTAIAAARGIWIAFLDSDDTWRKDKLERQIEALEKADPGTMACATGYYFHKNGRQHAFSFKSSPKEFRREIDFGCTISPGSTLVVRRQVFGEIGMFDDAFRRLEDWDWLLRYVNRYDLIFVPTPLADISQTDSWHQPNPADVENALDRIRVKHLSGLPLLARMRLQGSLLVEKAAIMYRTGRPFSAVFYVVVALCAYPFRNVAFFRMLWRSVRTRARP